MIKIMMIGCVGNDAELKEIKERQYACFDLAHSEKIRGEKKTTWIRVRKLDQDGQLCQWIKKGKPLYVEGRPVAGAYINKEGNPTAELTIWADRLDFIAGTGDFQPTAVVQQPPMQAQPQQQVHQQQAQPAVQRRGTMPQSSQFQQPMPQQAQQYADIPDFEDDLPF